MTDPTVWSALASGLSADWQRIHAERLHDIAARYHAWRSRPGAPPDEGPEIGLIRFLPLVMREAEDRLVSLHRHASDFSGRHARAATDAERQQHVLNFARDLGAGARQLKRDESAFGLWFGADAVTERFQRQVAAQERLLALCAGRLAALTCMLIERDPSGAATHWRSLDIGTVILRTLKHRGEERVRLAACEALDLVAAALPPTTRESILGLALMQTTLRIALDGGTSVWIQSAALSTLSRVSVDWLCRAVRRRFEYPDSPDDLFVRARAIGILARVATDSFEARALIEEASRDPSAHVRQAVASALAQLPEDSTLSLLPILAVEDAEPAVRAAALLSVVDLALRPTLYPVCLATAGLSLKSENDGFVARTTLKVVADTHRALREPEYSTARQNWERGLAERIDAVHARHERLDVRRWAGEARERIWSQRRPLRSETLDELRQRTSTLRSGQRLRLKVDPELGGDELARLLTVQAQHDCGFDLDLRRGRARILKHDRFGFRLWRLIHETRHPATDKRQAFRHTTGRAYPSRIQAQSQIMAELSETKVPGEPLYDSAEGGWRPYLPLVDQAISACGLSGRPMQLFSAEGVTVVTPPGALHRRLATRMKLIWKLPELSRLRNWKSGDSQPAQAYVQALRQCGITIEFREHPAEEPLQFPSDPAVQRFFGINAVILPPQLLDSFAEYFVSLYQNSLRELVAFLIAVTALFFGRHIHASYRMRSYRRSVPLVIGGWGTRGKSGTERLKAALFSGLGLNIVSKTTGCEAMFVHGHAYGRPRELFLFRPYDKATIWEQVDVMRIARDLNCEVFLWECMGLTPSYVYTLQRQWMRDDLATICNTYPDHEDLQGPAGINIPQVMQNFVPENRTVISTEEQMTPLLEQEAIHSGSRFVRAGWLQAGLITPDLRERYPYEEHPLNMALVCATATELGIERDYALKEMADNVIPDLGVLKAYPHALRRTRRLEFVMGMSANERLGCMGNWNRMGFGSHDPHRAPGVWTSTVVNNRADRVARSRVFASILVKDVTADRHVLIGTNLDGLRAYMREAWNQIAETKTLWPEPAADRSPIEILTTEAEARRIPTSADTVRARLVAMLQGIGADTLVADAERWLRSPSDLAGELEATHPDVAADVERFLRAYLDEFASFEALAAKAAQAPPSESLNQEFRNQLWAWFERHLIVVDDEHATGDQIIRIICEATPPGVVNRIMGMQNIKGTGLGYVYAWQAWEDCARAAATLLTACWDDASADLQARLHKFKPSGFRKGNLALAERGLRALAEFQEYNLLCEETIREVCATVRSSAAAQSELFQAELNVIEQTLADQMQTIAAADGQLAGRTGVLGIMLSFIESALDAGDAISRRRRANLIYRELGAERIGTARAAKELQKLTKRQKGGWFSARAQQAWQQIVQDVRHWLRRGRPLARRTTGEHIADHRTH